MEKYNMRGIPSAFVISKDGKVHWHGHPMDPGFEVAIQECVRAPSKLSYDPNKMTEEELSRLPIKDLKAILQSQGKNYSDLVEKSEFVRLIKS
jgi:hypothetical protein